MLPGIVLVTKSVLYLIQVQQRLLSVALGATRFQNIFRMIVVTVATLDITTSISIVIAHAANETAALHSYSFI
jgi:ABC-type phosphate transport system permease subunit